MAFKYHCSLKYNGTKILHHTLPLYFLFYFPFSSKKKFPTKKYLANSLEIKIKWPALCHLIINMFVFTGNLFFFGVYEHVQISVLWQEGNWGLKVTLLFREHMDQLAVKHHHFRDIVLKKWGIYVNGRETSGKLL